MLREFPMNTMQGASELGKKQEAHLQITYTAQI